MKLKRLLPLILLPFLLAGCASEQTAPNSYRQKVLCDKASEILATTDLSIEEISSMLKFSSAAYFRKIFKEHTGTTPSGFRKLYHL